MAHLLALIFDLDGTLVDSAADLRQALNSLLAVRGGRALSIDEVKGLTGDGLRPLLERAFVATGLLIPQGDFTQLFDEFLALYNDQTASADQLYDGVLDTVSYYRDKGVKIGLCTNKLYQPTLKLLREIGIFPLFDFIAGSDTFRVFKPDPGHVLGVAQALKVPPNSCVMIGDSVNDIRAARGAHVASIAVAYGYGQNIELLGADAYIPNFRELPDALGRLGFDVVGRDKVPTR